MLGTCDQDSSVSGYNPMEYGAVMVIKVWILEQEKIYRIAV